jgi:hypothetical protein
MPQPQCSLRAFQSAVLSRPPCNNLKHGAQEGVDPVSLSATLALLRVQNACTFLFLVGVAANENAGP